MTISLRTTGLLLGGLLVLTACGGSSDSTAETATAIGTSVEDTAKKEPLQQQAQNEAGSAGTYIDYADFDVDRAAYADADVVLFFHAAWCSTCKQADGNLTADPAGIPAGLTIVKVDFDSSTDLRREYGVTQQHTFVSIGPDGSKKKVFTGAVKAADIAERA